jgi:hypothetical protein
MKRFMKTINFQGINKQPLFDSISSSHTTIGSISIDIQSDFAKSIPYSDDIIDVCINPELARNFLTITKKYGLVKFNIDSKSILEFWKSNDYKLLIK